MHAYMSQTCDNLTSHPHNSIWFKFFSRDKLNWKVYYCQHLFLSFYDDESFFPLIFLNIVQTFWKMKAIGMCCLETSSEKQDK